MTKQQQMIEYLRYKDFWDMYFSLGSYVCDIGYKIAHTTDMEQTLTDSLVVIQKTLSLINTHRDIIDNYRKLADNAIPSSKEYEKSLYDLEYVIVDLLDEE